MPLFKGRENVGRNIAELMRSKRFGAGKNKEKRRQMAIAAALDYMRRHKREKTK